MAMTSAVDRGAARARAGVALEIGGLVVAVIIAVALSMDDRATALHRTSVWIAVGAGTIPPLGFFTQRARPTLIDVVAAIAMLCASVGSYTIGGLALLLPAAVLLVAGFLHFVATPEGRRVTRAETGRPKLIGGLVAAAFGAFFSLSFSLFVLVGWALLIAAIYLLGSFLSARRRARGDSGALGWIQAVAITIGVALLPWVIALSVTATS